MITKRHSWRGRRGGWPAAAAGALALLAGLCAAAAADPIELRSQTVALDAARPEETRLGRLEFRGGITMVSPDRRFGGFSSLHIGRAGEEMLALSDRGYWLKARLIHDEDGTLIGVDGGEVGPMLGEDGLLLGRTDMEAMAALPGGDILVAFEDRHRLMLYPKAADNPPFSQAPRVLEQPPGLADAPRNGGIEALTRLNDGRILAIAEKMPAEGAEGAEAYAAWVGGEPGWRRLSYRRTGAYRATAADTLPPATRWEGSVVVVERSFNIVDGLSIRVLLIPPDQIKPAQRIAGFEIARFEPPVLTDNLEGVAARRGPQGETYLYFISDDNYSPIHKTTLLMFELKE